MGIEINTLIRLQQGKPVSIKQIFGLFGKAWVQVANMSTAVNSFKKPGLWPFNAAAFKDSDFAASEVDPTEDVIENYPAEIAHIQNNCVQKNAQNGNVKSDSFQNDHDKKSLEEQNIFKNDL